MSPRGELLVSGSVDTTLRVWQVATGASKHVLRGHTSDVSSVCVVGGAGALGGMPGAIVCSSAFDSTLRIWDIEAGACLRVLADEDDFPFISNVAVFGSHHVISISSFNPMRVWTIDRAKCVDVIPRSPESVVTESLARLFDAEPALVLERGDLFLPVVFAAGAIPFYLDDAVTAQIRVTLRDGRCIVAASSGPAVHFLEVVAAGTAWSAASLLVGTGSASPAAGNRSGRAAAASLRSPGLPPLHPTKAAGTPQGHGVR